MLANSVTLCWHVKVTENVAVDHAARGLLLIRCRLISPEDAAPVLLPELLHCGLLVAS